MSRNTDMTKLNLKVAVKELLKMTKLNLKVAVKEPETAADPLKKKQMRR